MVEEGGVDELEFTWGKKRGRGGKKKDVQFYESFSYDGTEYTLFDSVYLYKEGEPEPYVGKIVKIWEQADKIKKVKILWFFRPCEILNYLGVEEPPRNELFLASGDGDGLANINPLEAIAGKCNVVCTSTDSRNRQPTDEELRMADFVFYRVFDVGKCAILDSIDEKIAGVEVKFLLNGVEKDIDEKVLVSNATVLFSEQGISVDTSAKENKCTKDRFGEKRSSLGENLVSVATAELDKLADTILVDNTTSRCQADPPDGDKVKGGNNPVDQVDIEREVISEKHSDGLDSRPLKKVKLDSSVNQSDDKKNVNTVEKLNLDSGVNDPTAKVPRVSASENVYKHKLAKDSHGGEEAPSKRLKPNGELPAAPLKDSSKEDKTDGHVLVTRRPDADRSKWFNGLPWEQRMQSADEEGTLVLLQNLDPTYTSAEVEDIVWHGFKERCTAKMIQKTAFSSPLSGQALIIFKTREVAGTVVRKLDGGCLMLPNGRFLIGSIASPCVQEKLPFLGHIVIDKLKLQMQREMKQAVSTSHCSQPNTIEYEMAMDWCLLQERSDRSWKKLFKIQGDEFRKLKASLKSK